jgi:hypothetical protein
MYTKQLNDSNPNNFYLNGLGEINPKGINRIAEIV